MSFFATPRALAFPCGYTETSTRSAIRSSGCTRDTRPNGRSSCRSGVPAAVAYFSLGWKVYVGLGIFTFAFLTTFAFQHCCVGMQSFREHLKHRGWKGVAEDSVGSLVWPWCWFQLDHVLKGWYMSFPDAVCNAFEYWLMSSWRGTTFTHIDVQTGETTTTRLKTPEDTRDAIRNVLTKNLAEEK